MLVARCCITTRLGQRLRECPHAPPQSNPNWAESAWTRLRPPLSLAWVTGGRQRDPARSSVVRNVPYRYQGAASRRGWATRCRYPPCPGPLPKVLLRRLILHSPSRGSQEVDSVTQPGAQLSGMDDMGNTVPPHHEVGPHVADISPTRSQKKVLLRIAWIEECCCVAHSPPSRASCTPGAAGWGRWVGRTG